MDKSTQDTRNVIDRKLEILNLCHKHLVNANGLSSIYPENFPEAYRDTALLAMERYKSDDKPRLLTQLEGQDEYLEALEKRKNTLPDWRYQELKKAAEGIKDRINNDLKQIDVI